LPPKTGLRASSVFISAFSIVRELRLYLAGWLNYFGISHSYKAVLIVQQALSNRWLEEQGVPKMRTLWIELDYGPNARV
jgi:hypothetical protein